MTHSQGRSFWHFLKNKFILYKQIILKNYTEVLKLSLKLTLETPKMILQFIFFYIFLMFLFFKIFLKFFKIIFNF